MGLEALPGGGAGENVGDDAAALDVRTVIAQALDGPEASSLS